MAQTVESASRRVLNEIGSQEKTSGEKLIYISGEHEPKTDRKCMMHYFLETGFVILESSIVILLLPQSWEEVVVHHREVDIFTFPTSEREVPEDFLPLNSS